MIGRTISHYRVLEKIGGGGMGVVYKAEDTKLRRIVALKFLAPELTRDEDAKRRFVHEAQAASALDHPNICSIFDIDETPEGQLYIAMACYEGETLKSRIARRKLEVREAFEIAFSVAQGLARAHANGIIHRDIKPGNVMITNDGFVKIVDFGLAKLIGRSRITGSGATLGTVAYMAPEQARSEEADERADIWSIGAVLYEMLTGRLPFRGEIDQAMVYSILNENPTPLKELRSDVPDACAAVVMKCLDKDPNRRYASALEFCAAIIETSEKVGWGGSFATGSVRAVSIVRGGRGRRRQRAFPLVAAALVLVIAGTLAWRLWGGGGIYSTKTRLAVMPFERLGDSPSQAFVDGLSQWTWGAFDRSSRFGKSIWVLPYGRILDDRPRDTGRVRTAFGVNRIVTGEVTPFENAYRLTLTLADARTLHPIRSETVDIDVHRMADFPHRVAVAVANLSEIELTGEHARIVEGPPSGSSDAVFACIEGLGYVTNWNHGDAIDRALATLGAATRADPSWVPARAALGSAGYWCFHLRADSACAADAERELTAAIAQDSSWVDSYASLAGILLSLHRENEAIDVLRAALRWDPRNLTVLEWLGSAYSTPKRWVEAERTYRALAAAAPDYYMAHWCLGWLSRQTGHPDQEVAEHTRALELAPDDFRALNSLGLYYSDRGDRQRAREFWERAFLVRPNCASCSNVGWVMYFEGRFDESARWYEYAMENCDTTRFLPWANLANALYWSDGGRERTTVLYRRAIELAAHRLRDVPDDTETASWLADCYAMLGERENALQMAERAASATEAGTLCRLGGVYEKLGDRAQALHYIGEAIRRNHPRFEIEHDPILQDLVKDPRYRELVELATADTNRKDKSQ